MGFATETYNRFCLGRRRRIGRLARRRSAAVGRQLRMLRAHGLIRKLSHTHRYQLSERGRQLINGLQAAQAASVNQLLRIAA